MLVQLFWLVLFPESDDARIHQLDEIAARRFGLRDQSAVLAQVAPRAPDDAAVINDTGISQEQVRDKLTGQTRLLFDDEP